MYIELNIRQDFDWCSKQGNGSDHATKWGKDPNDVDDDNNNWEMIAAPCALTTCSQSYKPVGPSTVPPQTDSNLLISRCSESPGNFDHLTKNPLDGFQMPSGWKHWQSIIDRIKWEDKKLGESFEVIKMKEAFWISSLQDVNSHDQI